MRRVARYGGRSAYECTDAAPDHYNMAGQVGRGLGQRVASVIGDARVGRCRIDREGSRDGRWCCVVIRLCSGMSMSTRQPQDLCESLTIGP